jgi:hypothetical protein
VEAQGAVVGRLVAPRDLNIQQRITVSKAAMQDWKPYVWLEVTSP